jgi:hypothetical protein
MTAHACFLQIKAFGDFVIAAAAAERVAAPDRPYVTLAIGSHLVPLCAAVGPSVNVIELDTGEMGVPSLFDVRRNGLPSAIRSAWRLRRTMAQASIQDGSLILADQIAWRERAIIGKRPSRTISSNMPNIYEGYDCLLREIGFEITPAGSAKTRADPRVGIFPGSRIATKNLPISLVADLMTTMTDAGQETDLFLLQGERPDLEASGLPHKIIPRRFDALRDAIASTDRVFSADSLPAHLAEMLGVSVFVMTPRPNDFWMPRSVFQHRRWSLFNDADRLTKAVTMLDLGGD